MKYQKQTIMILRECTRQTSEMLDELDDLKNTTGAIPNTIMNELDNLEYNVATLFAKIEAIQEKHNELRAENA